MKKERLLLLGVGNILYTDEGVGVHAAQYFEKHYTFPDHVTLMDGGTMGKLLMSSLMDHDFVLVMDAVLGGSEPGTIYRLTDDNLRKSLGFHDSQHGVDFVDTLISCEIIGNRPEAVVIGMEPLDWKTLGTELSPLCAEKFPKFISHIIEELETHGVVPVKNS